MDWKEYFRGIAHSVKLKSKDRNTQIGAVVVSKDNQILATGYNSFPKGMNDDLDERQERPEKYFWFEHAERNAIYSAARNGVKIEGATMYLTCWTPCSDCARAIINSGVKKVYVESIQRPNGDSAQKWDEHTKRSLVMFEECGVELLEY